MSYDIPHIKLENHNHDDIDNKLMSAICNKAWAFFEWTGAVDYDLSSYAPKETGFTHYVLFTPNLLASIVNLSPILTWSESLNPDKFEFARIDYANDTWIRSSKDKYRVERVCPYKEFIRVEYLNAGELSADTWALVMNKDGVYIEM